jgi:hypothetical protein
MKRAAPSRATRDTTVQASADATSLFPQAQPFIVQTKKHSGQFFEYGRYAHEAEARNVCRLLAWAGAVCRIVREP